MQPYHHFTLIERENIQELYKENKSIRYIARILERAPSSISRELARNKNKNGTYHHWRATTLYIIRRRKSRKPFRLSVDKELYEWVSAGLGKYWSPEIIAQRWKKEKVDNKLSHSTIYSSLKRGIIKGYTPRSHLRRHGKRKNMRHFKIKPEHLIREWPNEIVSRSRFGDWEGDTMYGAINKGSLLTLVDRKSRFLVVSLLQSRKANITRDSIVASLQKLLVNSLSFDNGSEFARFKELENKLNTVVYFADPHSPWQRGSNENINGLIRFFPKGTNFHNVSQEELDSVLGLINNRPRKCLDWLSPIEFIRACCT